MYLSQATKQQTVQNFAGHVNETHCQSAIYSQARQKNQEFSWVKKKHPMLQITVTDNF